MAAAFDRAGFAAFDVHMSDIIAGPPLARRFRRLRRLRRLLLRRRAGRRRGLGEVDPVQRAARATSSRRSSRARDTFALGVCNGCQMMSNLHELIPGAAHWPHFVRNRSEQFEARLVLLEVQPSPSLFFRGMEGSRIPVATAHGEGYAEFRDAAQLAAAQPLVALRFVDNRGAADRALSVQPERLAAGHHRAHDRRRPLHDPDAASRARVPHACRCRGIPTDWGEDSPWMRMFRNARVVRWAERGAGSGDVTRRSEDDAMNLTVYAIDGVTPVVDPTAYVHPTAVLIGDVIVGPGCYIGPLRVPARRLRPARDPRRRQHPGHLRAARVSRAPTRSSRRTATSATARCCTAASSSATRWSA